MNRPAPLADELHTAGAVESQKAPKPTAGPWRVEFGEAVSVRSADDSRLCTVNWLRGRNGLRGRIEDSEGEANARLMAASLDLLAALKRLEGIAENVAQNENIGIMDDALAEARAAITKAENGT